MGNSAKEIDLVSYNDRLCKRLEQVAHVQVERAVKAATQEYAQYLSDKVNDVFKGAVDHFYKSYTPKHNKRTLSLYKILYTKVEANGGLTFGFNPEMMNGWQEGKSRTGIQGFYHSEEGLYDQVFRKGWHGGAGSISKSRVSKSTRGYGPHPNPGTPYWGTKASGRWSWGEPAIISSKSPFDEINDELDKYPEEHDKDALRLIIQKEFDKIVLPNGWWRG